MKILSAANHRYFPELWQFLRSLRRSGAAHRHEVIIYDLGLTDEQLDRLASRYGLRARQFDFDAYPPHLRDLAQCAWKPLIMLRELGDGPLLWLDSATVVKGDLADVEGFIRTHGLYTLTGQAELREWCHPATLAAMQVPPEHLDRRVRIGGVVGIDGSRPPLRALLERWGEYALDPAVINPPGASRANHRYDQSLLNNLLQQALERGELELAEAGDADISAIHPVRQLTTRNRVPGWCPLWALGALGLWHDTAKALNRLTLRAGRFYDITLGGIARLSKERFHLELDGPAGHRRLEPPPRHYWADPFLVSRDGRPWVLFEDYQGRLDRGRICALALDGEGPPIPVLEPPWHLSFPYPFEHAGQLYLLPESSAHGTLDLYRCEAFPSRWTLHRRLLHGVDIADAVLFEHAGRYWLLGAVRDPGAAGRHLALFHAEAPDSHDWTAHPVNAERRYAGQPHSGGRNGGALFRHAGHWVRPVQRNPDYYGQYLDFYRIDRLDPEHYEEVRIDPPVGGLPPRLHHFHQQGPRRIWDVRDRVGRLDLLRALLPGSGPRRKDRE